MSKTINSKLNECNNINPNRKGAKYKVLTGITLKVLLLLLLLFSLFICIFVEDNRLHYASIQTQLHGASR